MQYRTSIAARPAVALQPLLSPTPGVDADVYAGLASRAQVDLERQAQMANAEHVGRARDSQAQMAMQGIGQMASGRQQAIDLANARQSAAMGYMNNILKGLFT